MKIVILDGYVTNKGDLSWDGIAALGDLTVYDRTSPERVVERAADADAIFVNKIKIDADTIARLPKLKFIGEMATGYDNIDVAAARERGIVVSNVPAYSTESVVQTIFAHLLNITNAVSLHDRSVHKGAWQHCRDFCYRLVPLTEISGLTMGIYGLGNIGSRVAEVAHAFGMKVIALTSKTSDRLPGYITPVSKDDFFAQSDVVVLCAPLTADNRHFINASTLAMMKPRAILINTARGGLVDSQALCCALREGKIASAGIDVLPAEPPHADEPLLTAPNCCITPHIAWQGDVARARLVKVCEENLRAFISGRPINVVD